MAKDRKTRILDAAEKAFAELGFEGASLREIVREARVNLATVYYYFESKERLIKAVFNRRFDPLKQESLELLARFQSDAHGRPVPVEKIIEAMILPLLQLAARAAGKSRIVLRLIGRIVTEPNVQTQRLMQNEFVNVRHAFLSALQQALPGLPIADLTWRYEFFWGALSFTLINPRKLEKISEACNPNDPDAVLTQMTACFAPAFHAPGLPAKKRSSRKSASTLRK